MHRAQAAQQCGNAHAFRQTKLGRLLDAVDGVIARIGQPEHLGARGLRLHQQRRKLGGIRERITPAAQHLTTARGHKAASIALQLLAEHIIGGDEIPAIAASPHHRPGGRMRQHVSVIGPVYRIGRALRPGEIRRRPAGVEVGLVLLPRHRVDRQRDRRCRHVHNHIHPLLVEPLPRQAGPHIGLVLMVAGNHFHIKAVIAPFLHRLPGASQADRPAIIGIRAGHIVQHANLQLHPLCPGAARSGSSGGGSGGAQQGAARNGH